MTATRSKRMQTPSKVTITFECDGDSWQGEMFWHQVHELLAQAARKIGHQLEREPCLCDAEESADVLLDINGNRCGKLVVKTVEDAEYRSTHQGDFQQQVKRVRCTAQPYGVNPGVVMRDIIPPPERSEPRKEYLCPHCDAVNVDPFPLTAGLKTCGRCGQNISSNPQPGFRFYND